MIIVKLTKEMFVKAVEDAHRLDANEDSFNNLLNTLQIDGYIVGISGGVNIIRLLDELFNTDCVSYYAYELQWGTKYVDGCVVDINGAPIDISTPEKLYDYLIQQCGVQ